MCIGVSGYAEYHVVEGTVYIYCHVSLDTRKQMMALRCLLPQHVMLVFSVKKEDSVPYHFVSLALWLFNLMQTLDGLSPFTQMSFSFKNGYP